MQPPIAAFALPCNKSNGVSVQTRGDSAMYKLAVSAIVSFIAAGLSAQTGDKDKPVIRYGIELDIKKFPQNTPKDGLGSVLKAIGEKRFDYLLAHLTDPAFVDKQVTLAMAQLGSSL